MEKLTKRTVYCWRVTLMLILAFDSKFLPADNAEVAKTSVSKILKFEVCLVFQHFCI